MILNKKIKLPGFAFQENNLNNCVKRKIINFYAIFTIRILEEVLHKGVSSLIMKITFQQ